MAFYKNFGADDASIKRALINNTEFKFVHLVKFERPSLSDGQEDAISYGYYTDSTQFETYDDLSEDARGNFNGTQTYVPAKLLKVGDFKENQVLQNTSINLVFDSTAAGTSLDQYFNLGANTITLNDFATGLPTGKTPATSWTDAGFQEGDVIKGTVASQLTYQLYNRSLRIDSFSNNNRTAHVSALGEGEILLAATGNPYFRINFEIITDEITTFTKGQDITRFTEYLNRDVTIFRRIYIPNGSGGFTNAGTYQIFKGLVTNGKLNDDVLKSSTMTWSVSSHWAAFNTVAGRKTSDDDHRAINNGIPDLGAVKKIDYAGDLGFMHAEKAFNVAAKFRTTEEQNRVRAKTKWTGKTKVKNYTVIKHTARETQLNFNLSAGFIPVVYGVNLIDEPITAFADVMNTASTVTLTNITHEKLVTVQVLCEGQIANILDFHVDDEPVICVNEPDFEARHVNVESVPSRTCVGRADAGDIIQGNTIFNKNTITAKIAGAVTGSKTLTIDTVVGGTITAQMEITFEGAPEGLYIETVNSQTSIVVNIPVTVGNNVDLTIESDIGGYDLSNVGSTTDGTSNLNYITKIDGSGNFTDANLAVFGISGTRLANQMNVPYIQIGTNGSESSDVLTTTTNHSLYSGTRVKYVNLSGGSDIGGLVNGVHYFLIRMGANTLKLASTFKNALAGTIISLTNSDTTTSNAHQFHVDETPLGHETGIGLPLQKELLMFHAGKHDQKANEVLVSIASKPLETSSSIRPTQIEGSGLSILKANRGFEVIRTDKNLKAQQGVTFKTFVAVSDTKYNVQGGQNVIQATKIKTKKSRSRITGYVHRPIKDFTDVANLTTGNTMDVVRRGLYATYKNYGRGEAFYRLYDSMKLGGALSRLSSGIELKSHTVTVTDISLGNLEKGFKIQHDFFQNYPTDYWGDDHRLLDTAYVVSIKEMHSGETNQEMHKYVIKGKFIECHNYDDSFLVSSGEDQVSNYAEGDSVYIGGGAVQITLNNIIASDTGTNASSKVLEVHAKHFSGETKVDQAGGSFTNGSQIFVYNQTDNTLDADSTIVVGHAQIEDIYTDGIHVFCIHETFMSVFLITTGALVTRQVMYSNQGNLGGADDNFEVVGGGGTPRYSMMEARQKRLVTGITGDGTYVYVYSPQHIACNQLDHPYNTIAGDKKSGRSDIRRKYTQTSGVVTPGMHYGQVVPAAIYRFTLSKLTAGTKYSQNRTLDFGHAVDDLSDGFREKYWASADNRDHQIHTWFGQDSSHKYDDDDDTNNDQTMTPWPGKYTIVMPDYMVEQSDGIDRSKAIPAQLQAFKKFNNLFQCYFDTTYTFKQENELPKGCTTDGTTLWVADWTCKVGNMSNPETDGFYAPGFTSSTRTMRSNINGLRAINNDTTTLVGVDNYDGLDNEFLIKDFSGSATIYAYNLLTGARDASKDILPYVPTLSASHTSYDKTVSAVNNRRRFVGASAFNINDTGRTAQLHQNDKNVNCTFGSELTLNNVDNLHRGMALHFKAADAKSYVYGDFMPNKARPTCTGSEGAKTNQASISAITKADPGVITANAHGFENGDKVVFEGIGGMTQLNADTNLELYNTPFEIFGKATNTFKIKLNGTQVDTSSYGTYTSGGTVLSARPDYSSRGHLGLNRPVIMAIDSANNKVLLNRFVEIPDTSETVEFGYDIQALNQYSHQYNDIDRLDHEGSTNTEPDIWWRAGNGYTYGQTSYHGSGNYNTQGAHFGREFGTVADAPYDVSHVVLDGVNCMMILNKHREHIVHDIVRGHNPGVAYNVDIYSSMFNHQAKTYVNEELDHHTATEYTVGSHVFCYNIDTGRMFDKVIRVPLGTVGICTYTYSNGYSIDGVVDGNNNNPTFLYCLVEYIESGLTKYKVSSFILNYSNNYTGYAANFGRDEKNIVGSVEMKGTAWDGDGWFSRGSGGNQTRGQTYNMPGFRSHGYTDQHVEYGYNYTQHGQTLGAHYDFNTNATTGLAGLSTINNAVKLHGISVVPGQTYTKSGYTFPVLAACAIDQNTGKNVIITNEPTTTARKHYTRDSSTDKLAGLAFINHGGSNRAITIEKADFHTTSEATARQNPVVRSYTDDGDNTLSNYNTFFTDGDDAVAPLGETRSASNKTSVIESLHANTGNVEHIKHPASNSFDFVPAVDSNSVPLLYKGFFLNDSDSAYFTRGTDFHEYDYTDTSMSRGAEDLHTTSSATENIIITSMTKEDSFDGSVKTRISFDTNFPKADVDSYTLSTDGSSNAVILDAKNIFPAANSTPVIHATQGKGPTLTLGSGWDSQAVTFVDLDTVYTTLGLEDNLVIRNLHVDPDRTSSSYGLAFWCKIREGAITYTNGDWALWDSIRSLKLASGVPARFQKMIYTQAGIATVNQNLTVRILDGPDDLLPEHLIEETDQIIYRHTPPGEVVEGFINEANNTDRGVDEFITYDNAINLGEESRVIPQVGDEFIFEGQEVHERFYVTAVDGSTGFKLNKDISWNNSSTTQTTHGSSISSGTPTITLSGANTAIEPGQRVTATSGIASNTKVLSIDGTTLTLDKNTTGTLSSGATLTFTDVTVIQFLSHQMIYLATAISNAATNTDYAQQVALVADSTGVTFSFDDVIVTDGNAYPTTRDYQPEMTFRTDNAGTVTKQGAKAMAFDDINSIAIVDVSTAFAVLGLTQYKFPTTSQKDLRVTTNPALQLLDYLTSKTYGRGLRLNFKPGTGTGAKTISNRQNDIDFDSFIETARLCDGKSMVTVCMKATATAVANVVSNSATVTFTGLIGDIDIGDIIHTGIGDAGEEIRKSDAITVTEINIPTSSVTISQIDSITAGKTLTFTKPVPSVGDKYAYNFGGVVNGTSARNNFQGTVYSVTERRSFTDNTVFNEIVFDDVRGYLGKRWASWKELNEEIVYNPSLNDPLRAVGSSTTTPTTYLASEIQAFNQLGYRSLRMYKIGDASAPPLIIDIALDGIKTSFNEDATKSTGSIFTLHDFNKNEIEDGAFGFLLDGGGVTRKVTASSINAAANTVVLSWTGGGTIQVADTQAEETGNVNFNLTLTNTGQRSDRMTPDGNPIVKAFDTDAELFIGSGYSLYDADHVKYWRHIGWNEQHQKQATRHQLNTKIDTGGSVFDNTNNILQQMNGILTYSGGLYSLDVKRKQDINLDGSTTQLAISSDSTSDVSVISEDEIIGKIQVADKGVKGSFNSIDATILDPSIKFESRTVAFFNSDYLEEDNNMPKKGTYQCPFITNYFNARMNVKQHLDSSRFGLNVLFTMSPKGALLRPGMIIKLNSSRLNFVNKLFRIDVITQKTNGLIDIEAIEHSDSTFLLEKVDATANRLSRGRCVSGTKLSIPIAPSDNPDNT